MIQFGNIRSFCHEAHPPSEGRFVALCELLEHGDASQEILSYLKHYLSRWPLKIKREVPNSWWSTLCKKNGAIYPNLIDICNSLTIDIHENWNAKRFRYFGDIDSIKYLTVMKSRRNRRRQINRNSLVILFSSEGLKNIESLDVSNLGVCDEELMLLGRNRHIKSIRSIVLDNNSLTNASMIPLFQSNIFKNLEKLSISDLLVDDVFLASLMNSSLSNIMTAFYANDTRITRRSFAVFAEHHVFNNLKHLSLNGTAVDDESIFMLRYGSSLGNLFHLNLDRCYIHDEPSDFGHPVRNTNNLNVLSLSHNRINNKTLQSLAENGMFSNVQHVFIKNTQIILSAEDVIKVIDSKDVPVNPGMFYVDILDECLMMECQMNDILMGAFEFIDKAGSEDRNESLDVYVGCSDTLNVHPRVHVSGRKYGQNHIKRTILDIDHVFRL